jgi:hypothetical protein
VRFEIIAAVTKNVTISRTVTPYSLTKASSSSSSFPIDSCVGAKGFHEAFPVTSLRCQPQSVRLFLRVVSITNKFKKCELLAHSSRVLCWNNHLSSEHLCVFHFVWHLPFDLFGLGDSTSSYATAVTALRVIGARKPHHHDKVNTWGVTKAVFLIF